MNKSKTTQSVGVLIGATFLAGALSANAQSTLINFYAGASFEPNNMSGAAVLGTSGDQWNSYLNDTMYVGTTSAINLNNVAGAGTGVSLTLGNFAGTSYYSSGNGSNPSPLMNGYIYSAPSGDGWPIRASLTGLTVGESYQLVVYSAGHGSGEGATINITDPTFSTIYSSASTTGLDENIANGQGDAYQIFTGTIGSGGTLNFDVANTSSYHALNGFQLQLVAVPEPSTLALAGMGGLMTLGWFRRRSSK